MGAFSLKKSGEKQKMFSSQLEKNSSLSSPSLPVIKASFIVCVSLCVIWLQWTAVTQKKKGLMAPFPVILLV